MSVGLTVEAYHPISHTLFSCSTYHLTVLIEWVTVGKLNETMHDGGQEVDGTSELTKTWLHFFHTHMHCW